MGVPRPGLPDAIGNAADSRALAADQPPTGHGRARIDAEHERALPFPASLMPGLYLIGAADIGGAAEREMPSRPLLVFRPNRWRIARMKTGVVIVAAGRGERLGFDLRKAMVLLGDRPCSCTRSSVRRSA